MRAVEKKRFRKQLLEKRRELLESFKRTQEAHMQPGEEGMLDLADRATESYTKEFLYRLSDNERARLREVEEAILRLDEGTYEQCQECGTKIPTLRLKAIPWASLCLDCQEQLEATRAR